MTKSKRLSAALIAAVMLATPAMARKSHVPRGISRWTQMRAFPTRPII